MHSFNLNLLIIFLLHLLHLTTVRTYEHYIDDTIDYSSIRENVQSDVRHCIMVLNSRSVYVVRTGGKENELSTFPYTTLSLVFRNINNKLCGQIVYD